MIQKKAYTNLIPANKLLKVFLYLFLSILFINLTYGSQENENKENIRFFLVYETLTSLNLNKAVLYYSKEKTFNAKDSILLNIAKDVTVNDSFLLTKKWQYPAYLKLKLLFSDRSRSSNVFQYSKDKQAWEVLVGDTILKIHPKYSDNYNNQSSLKGLVIVIQTVYELILALLISRIFGWPHIITLTVLVANIAVFPLYLLNIPALFLREGLVFLVKTLVMWAIAIRKLHILKIILLAIVLFIASFGMKQLLFFIIQIL